MPAFQTRNIAFAPASGPMEVHRLLWEKLPLAAQHLHEGELVVRVYVEKPLAKWHLVVKKKKGFVEAQMSKLLDTLSANEMKVKVHETPRSAELVMRIPVRHADEFLNAHNIFFHTFLPHMRISASQFEMDFSPVNEYHIHVSGTPRALSALHLPLTHKSFSKKSTSKKSMPPKSKSKNLASKKHAPKPKKASGKKVKQWK